jgi:RNA polymerase sigma-70 factor, ECF subfamily
MRWRDGRLLRGLRTGDPAARGRLLEDIYPRLFAYLCHLCGDRDRAADLAQETAMRMWRALPDLEYRSLPSLLSWAHRVAHSTYVDARRAERDEMPLDAAALVSSGEPLAARAAAHLDGDAARAAVVRLPEHYRQVVVLRFLQGLSYREVAGALDIPPGTVRSRLAKALELLRRDLSGEERDHAELRTRATDSV